MMRPMTANYFEQSNVNLDIMFQSVNRGDQDEEDLERGEQIEDRQPVEEQMLVEDNYD